MSNLNVILLDLLYGVIDANIAVKGDHQLALLMMSLLRRTHTNNICFRIYERRFDETGVPIVVLDFYTG